MSKYLYSLVLDPPPLLIETGTDVSFSFTSFSWVYGTGCETLSLSFLAFIISLFKNTPTSFTFLTLIKSVTNSRTF
jgi:hypothetical protein